VDQALGTPQAAKFGQWLALLTKTDSKSDTKTDTKVDTELPVGHLLRTYGVWGCLLAGCLLAKTAKYTVTDLNTSLEYVLMAARLLSSVFECDTVHPVRLCDFAVYTPTQVWGGVDLLGERYRCNSRAMLDALEFEGMELVAAGYALEALPLLALYEHLARYAVKSTNHTVHARVMRSQALIQLGLLAEAYHHLRSLQLGYGLPRVIPPVVPYVGSGGALFGSTTEDATFCNWLPSTHERNSRALQILADTILVST
jgi:hypothetical protein